jgi:hypothetical protein
VPGRSTRSLDITEESVDIEALLVIGTVFAVIGAVLFLISRLWARWWLRKHPEDVKIADAKTIRAVILFLVIWVGGMISAASAPESTFAKLISGPGFVVWTFLSSTVGWVIASATSRQRSAAKREGDV